MDIDGMIRLSGQSRDEILCETYDYDYGFGCWDERKRHGSPYEDFVTFDDDDEYEMDAMECAEYFECGYGRERV